MRRKVSVALMCSSLLQVLSVCNVYVQSFRKPASLYLMVLSQLVRSLLSEVRAASAFQHCGQLQAYAGRGGVGLGRKGAWIVKETLND